MEKYAKQALEAISGAGIGLLTNIPEGCYDSTHHTRMCTHEKEDRPCPKCVSCNPKKLRKSDVFWWTSNSFKNRYRHEAAKVGDKFYDGNNGDKHEVIAVDLEAERLAYRNLSQNEELLQIACW